MAVTDVAPPADLDDAQEGGDADERLTPGTRVEVRSRLEARRWSRGFEVIDADGDGYRLRRLSDGEAMPVALPAEDVRKERKRGGWWY